jgi:hypothetical protein
MSNTKNTANNNVSNNNIIIKYHFTSEDIEVQFDSNAIGIIIVVNNIKYIDIPSTPKYMLSPIKLYGSCTYWNWLKEKSKNIKIINDNIKLIIDVVNDIILIDFKYVFVTKLNKLVEIINIPSNGIINNNSNIQNM